MKKTVDEVVDRLEEIPAVQACYDQWCASRVRWKATTTTNPERRKAVSGEGVPADQKRCHPGGGAHPSGGDHFEDAELAGHDEAEQVQGESMPAGNYGRSSGTSTFLWTTGPGGGEAGVVAERGDTHAQYWMGQLYRDGPLLIPDSQKAKHWFTQAAEQG